MQHSTLAGKRILLADNEIALRHTFVPQLEAAGLVVEMCLNGVELQRTLSQRATEFDAVVTDLWDMGTAEARFIPERDIPLLVEAYPNLPVIIISSEAHQTQQYEEAGVRGYVLKIDTVRGLLQALDAVLIQNKPMYYSPSVGLTYRIGRRERQVLQGLSNGLTAKEIAKRLKLAVSTIETYVARLRAKLDARNTTELVAIALREGLIR